MGKLKKVLKGVGAFAVTIHVAPLGVIAAMVEEATKIDGGNIVSNLAYQGKSLAFNSVRKSWGKEPKYYEEATGTTSEAIQRECEEQIKKEAAKQGATKEKTEEVIARFRKKAATQTVKRIKFQEGASWNKTAFVFSCPGQSEMNLDSVCAGTTGVNLSMVLKYCNDKKPSVFPSPNKSDYLITNASDIVHFKGMTNDTEASDEELFAHNNLKRLRDELNNKNIIICMGERASTAVRQANIRGRVVRFKHHLSNQKLNRTYTNQQFSDDMSPSERREERIRLVSEELLKCF